MVYFGLYGRDHVDQCAPVWKAATNLTRLLSVGFSILWVLASISANFCASEISATLLSIIVSLCERSGCEDYIAGNCDVPLPLHLADEFRSKGAAYSDNAGAVRTFGPDTGSSPPYVAMPRGSGGRAMHEARGFT